MAIAPKMVTIDCDDPQRLVPFWLEATGYQVTNDWGGYVMLAPPEGDGVVIALQRVPEPRQGKNRVHIDFRAEDRPQEVQRLVKLGATVIAEHSVPGFTWTVLGDPEGNEFCVG